MKSTLCRDSIRRYLFPEAKENGQNTQTKTRFETFFESERISCFFVGSKKELCLPQILDSVFRGFSRQQIIEVCNAQNIRLSMCNTGQLEELKQSRILPSNSLSCELIAQFDAERLVEILLRPQQPCSPGPLDLRKKKVDYSFISSLSFQPEYDGKLEDFFAELKDKKVPAFKRKLENDSELERPSKRPRKNDTPNFLNETTNNRFDSEYSITSTTFNNYDHLLQITQEYHTESSSPNQIQMHYASEMFSASDNIQAQSPPNETPVLFQNHWDYYKEQQSSSSSSISSWSSSDCTERSSSVPEYPAIELPEFFANEAFSVEYETNSDVAPREDEEMSAASVMSMAMTMSMTSDDYLPMTKTYSSSSYYTESSSLVPEYPMLY